MGKQHENPEGIGTQRLPGTGGDLAPTDQDVEGHRRIAATFDGGPEEARRTTPGGGGVPLTDEDDVEGHLYTGGPSTRGEFIRRAPGDSPHGDS
jgi:hypothetical protein